MFTLIGLACCVAWLAAMFAGNYDICNVNTILIGVLFIIAGSLSRIANTLCDAYKNRNK